VYLLNKQGKLDEARVQLQQAKAATPAQRVQVLMIEAQLLNGAKKYSEAYKVLELGVVKLPDQPDLLYEAAMLADKLGKFDAAEKHLRHLIKLKPDHAHAYNALGYSLLERNVRIKEALGLVERALQLTPDDHAIMDSVGWGYYRSGKLDESVAMLQRAFAGNPDPEIAAHLGEVLWIRGDRMEAAKVWQDSLKAHPDNAPLQAVMKRYLP
jgi:tetratricopeptide (TPR) repeat protein